MRRRKKRKTTATGREVRKQRKKLRERRSVSLYRCKKRVIPGPWTNVETEVEIEAKLKLARDITGEPILGTYPRLNDWTERGWYPIYINIAADKTLIEKVGFDNYVAACEKSLNEQYKSLVIIDVVTRNDEYMSCLAKTTNKNISGFAAVRGGKYTILKKKKR